jgi:putative sterol carrier protein
MATLNEIFEQKIPDRIKNHPEKVQGIDAIYEFNITGNNGGIWSLDLTEGKKEVTTGSTGKARCIITMGADDFIQMVSGNLNPQMAFMGGKLKVAGDMGLALKLGNILG